jgi:hypothetical protein
MQDDDPSFKAGPTPSQPLSLTSQAVTPQTAQIDPSGDLTCVRGTTPPNLAPQATCPRSATRGATRHRPRPSASQLPSPNHRVNQMMATVKIRVMSSGTCARHTACRRFQIAQEISPLQPPPAPARPACSCAGKRASCTGSRSPGPRTTQQVASRSPRAQSWRIEWPKRRRRSARGSGPASPARPAPRRREGRRGRRQMDRFFRDPRAVRLRPYPSLPKNFHARRARQPATSRFANREGNAGHVNARRGRGRGWGCGRGRPSFGARLWLFPTAVLHVGVVYWSTGCDAGQGPTTTGNQKPTEKNAKTTTF